MAAKNRISVSVSDQSWLRLERLSLHYQTSKAEVVRTILEEYLRDNPNRFREKTTLGGLRSATLGVAESVKETARPGFPLAPRPKSG